MGKRRVSYRILMGKPEGSGPLGRPRRRWRVILKWIIKKLDGGMDWTYLAQNRDRWEALVNAAKKPSGPIKRGKFLDQLQDLRNCQLLKKDSVPLSFSWRRRMEATVNERCF